MLSCKAWAYGLDSISGCKAALEGSLGVTCEECLAALRGFMYKGVQVHYSVQHGKHVGQFLWINTTYHGHGYVEAFLNLVGAKVVLGINSNKCLNHPWDLYQNVGHYLMRDLLLHKGSLLRCLPVG